MNVFCISSKKNVLFRVLMTVTLKIKNNRRKESGEKHCWKNEKKYMHFKCSSDQLMSQVGALASHFKQKLAIHKFLIYNSKNSEFYYFIWYEGKGRMKSKIFASCISNILKSYVDLNSKCVLHWQLLWSKLQY